MSSTVTSRAVPFACAVLPVLQPHEIDRRDLRVPLRGRDDGRDVRVDRPVVAEALDDLDLRGCTPSSRSRSNPSSSFSVNALPAPALEVFAERRALVERERVDARDLVAAALVGREVELPHEADLVLRAVGALNEAEVLDVTRSSAAKSPSGACAKDVVGRRARSVIGGPLST